MVDSTCSACDWFDPFPGHPFGSVYLEAVAGFKDRWLDYPDASPAGAGHCVQE